MKLIDISIPIHDNMWFYKPGWESFCTEIESVEKGGSSTSYRFNLCSHTGTYIETTHHKLKEKILLSDFNLESFYREVKLVITETNKENVITLNQFEESLKRIDLEIFEGDAIIIATGYGENHTTEGFLSNSPSFGEDLLDFLCSKKLALLGVDTPIIENLKKPYNAVVKLFESNAKMLLLAPLKIDIKELKSAKYTLSCFPINVENVAVSICRPVLMENN